MKKIKYLWPGKLATLLFLLTTNMLYAQENWFFGQNCGVRFTNGVPADLTGSVMTSGEGSAVLVDGLNNTILYTNGTLIYNRMHAVQTATSGTLNGDNSSSQTAVIVPLPGTDGKQVFIFTVNAAENAYGLDIPATKCGLRVSLANIGGTAPNNTITIPMPSRNVRLTPDGVPMAEKLSVTPDGSGGFWVLTHGVGIYGNPDANPFSIVAENRFYAYHITCRTTSIQLLDATEVVSTMGCGITPTRSWAHPGGNSTPPPTPQNTLTLQYNGQGYMKFSQDGTRVCMTLPWFGNNNRSFDPMAQLFDFNLNTGVVGGNQALEFNLGFNGDLLNSANRDGIAYGVEFSPNNNLLYISSLVASGTFGTISSRIYQYNLGSGIAAQIAGSQYTVATLADAVSANGFAALQRGPDNRVYIARSGQHFLDAIANPNTIGVGCTYTPNAVNLTGTCNSGLPNVVLSSVTGVQAPADRDICRGDCISLAATYGGVTANPDLVYNWSIPPLSTIIGTQHSIIVCPTKTTTYRVTVTDPVSFCTSYDEVTVTVHNPIDASFSYTTNTGNPNFFTITATPNNLTPPLTPPANYDYTWKVEGFDANGNLIFTVDNPSCWLNFNPPGGVISNVFNGFDHIANAYSGNVNLLSCSTPALGRFRYNRKYRITRKTVTEFCQNEWFLEFEQGSAGLVVINEGPVKPDVKGGTAAMMPPAGALSGHEKQLTVSPNPGTGIFRVITTLTEDAALEVLDMTGHSIRKATLRGGSSYRLDLSGYPRGVYLLKLTGGGKVHTEKIMLQ